jgi:hypothetical protein
VRIARAALVKFLRRLEEYRIERPPEAFNALSPELDEGAPVPTHAMNLPAVEATAPPATNEG